MKRRLLAQTTFIGKSMLWSILLYITTMLVLNWDELSNSGKNRNDRSWATENKMKEKELVPVNVRRGNSGTVTSAATPIIKAIGFARSASDIIF